MPFASVGRETLLETNRHIFGVEHPVAFVTGSTAPRVGRVVAEYLFSRGFQVVLHGHSRPSDGNLELDEFREGAAEPLTLFGDVQDEGNLGRWLAEILERHQRVDVVVNSAAIWQPKPLEEVSSQDFEDYFRVNAMSVALACKYFGLQMVKQETGGAIVNFGDWSITRPYRDFPAYFPSKGAVASATTSMAIELAERNPRIRVNAVLPGPVMLDDSISEDRRKRLVKDSLLRREGTAGDVAHAAYMLLTNPFITGVCLPVDGGRSIYAGPGGDAVAHPDVTS